VRKVPDGLAVTLSLPIGCGSRPATSRLDTAHPIVAIAASSIETSMKVASWRSRSASAAAIAIAAVSPPIVSATGYPTRNGAVAASPVMLIIPDMPWMIWSYAGRSRKGPSWPKPEIAQ